MHIFDNKQDFYNKINVQQPNPEIDPLDYEDTILKEMADDIKQSQINIDKKLELLINENKKSEKTSNIISSVALIVGILTLFATLAGIAIQFF